MPVTPTLQCHCAAPCPGCNPIATRLHQVVFIYPHTPEPLAAALWGRHGLCAHSRCPLTQGRTRSGRMRDPWLPEHEPGDDKLEELFAQGREASHDHFHSLGDDLGAVRALQCLG